jgi:hypothetical protein
MQSQCKQLQNRKDLSNGNGKIGMREMNYTYIRSRESQSAGLRSGPWSGEEVVKSGGGAVSGGGDRR